jgi:ribosome-binding factor A
MTSRKPSREELLSSCADVGAEDGTDPRLFARKPTNKVANRKALQLCAQVTEALTWALGECGDDLLRDLRVAAVVPAPNSAHLLVTLTLAPASGPVTEDVLREHLQRAAGKLRTEVAAAIHRKRAPELMFRLTIAGGSGR